MVAQSLVQPLDRVQFSPWIESSLALGPAHCTLSKEWIIFRQKSVIRNYRNQNRNRNRNKNREETGIGIGIGIGIGLVIGKGEDQEKNNIGIGKRKEKGICQKYLAEFKGIAIKVL